MREFPGFIPSASAATDFQSVSLSVGDNVNFWIGILFTGSDVVGTLKLQGSDNNSDWWDISGSSQAVTASTRHAWSVSDVHYPYVRVDWDYTSGTGNISGRAIINQQILLRGG